MGFYGNITNTTRSSFTFDQIYSNRYSMDISVLGDGVFLGRYVLVEYDQKADFGLDCFIQIIHTNYKTSDLTVTDDPKKGWFLYTDYLAVQNQKYIDHPEWDADRKEQQKLWDLTQYLLTVAELDKEKVYYEIKTAYDEEGKEIANESGYTFYHPNLDGTQDTLFIEDFHLNKGELTSSDEYSNNYNIDKAKYANIGRGWDSTVWQKVYKDGKSQYVQIAELNTVVPTFGLKADPPSTTPIIPHFDKDSTNIYYQLHWQPNWGFRVAQAADLDHSDEKTIRIKHSYDNTTGKEAFFYWQPEGEPTLQQHISGEESGEWVEFSSYPDNANSMRALLDAGMVGNVDAAIYYNKKGFAPEYSTHSADNNSINVLPTGISGMEYDTHQRSTATTHAGKTSLDTQELTISLPAIGNMVADGYDLIYGVNQELPTDEKGNYPRSRDVAWKFVGEIADTTIGGMSRDESTLAGCLNVMHDLMGMIIARQEFSSTDQEAIDLADPSVIYYNENTDEYSYKNKTFDINPDIDDNFFEYAVVDVKSEDDYRPNTYYLKDGNNYIPDVNGTYNSSTVYYGKYISDQHSALYTEVEVEPYETNKYYTKVNNNYLKAKTSQPDENIEYYVITNDDLATIQFTNDYQPNKFYYYTANGFIKEKTLLPVSNHIYYDIKDPATWEASKGTSTDVTDLLIKAPFYEANKYYKIKTYVKAPLQICGSAFLYETNINSLFVIRSNEQGGNGTTYLPCNWPSVPEGYEEYTILPYDPSATYYVRGIVQASVNKETYKPNMYYLKCTSGTHTYYRICDSEVYLTDLELADLYSDLDVSINPETEEIQPINYWTINFELDNNGTMTDTEYYEPIGWTEAAVEGVQTQVPTGFHWVEGGLTQFTSNKYYYQNENGDLVRYAGVKNTINASDATSYPNNNYHVEYVDDTDPTSGYKITVLYDLGNPYDPRVINFEGSNLYYPGKYYYKDGDNYYIDNRGTMSYVLDEEGKPLEDEDGNPIQIDYYTIATLNTAFGPINFYQSRKYWYLDNGVYKRDDAEYTGATFDRNRTYYTKDNYYIYSDTSNILAKGATWISETNIIPWTVELGIRTPRFEMKLLPNLKAPYGDGGENPYKTIKLTKRQYIPGKYYIDKYDVVLSSSIDYDNTNPSRDGYFEKVIGNMFVIDTAGYEPNTEYYYFESTETQPGGDHDPNADYHLITVANAEDYDTAKTNRGTLYTKEKTLEWKSSTDATASLDKVYYTRDINYYMPAADADFYCNVDYRYEFRSSVASPSSIYGFILQLAKLTNFGDELTRDTSTVQGCLNYLSDYIYKLGDLRSGELMIVDDYGRMHSSPFTTAQEHGFTNVGKPSASQAVGNEEEDYWINFDVDSSTNSNVTMYHNFHGTSDTTTTSDKNAAGGNGLNAAVGDTLSLYTPIVDNTGHVIGKNTETVTLPYGFKTVNIGTQSTAVNESASNTTGIVADNTQDTMTLKTGNQWIRLAGTAGDDSITIGHKISNLKNHGGTDVAFNNGTSNWYGQSADKDFRTDSDNNGNAFKIPYFQFDSAGHIIGIEEHTIKTAEVFENVAVTVPSTAVTNGAAVSTEITTKASDSDLDTLKFSPSNKWIRLNLNNEVLSIGHQVNTITKTNKTATDLNDPGDTITVQDTLIDEAGHVTALQSHTYTLPYGYKIFKDSQSTVGTSTADSTKDTFVFKGDSWVKPVVSNDLLTLTHEGPVSTSHTTVNNVTPAFGDTFTITDWDFDNKGHKANSGTHTVKIPQGSLTPDSTVNANIANVITGFGFTPSTGAMTLTQQNVGTLKITNYTLGTDTGAIAATDTINGAFSKAQAQLNLITGTTIPNAISSANGYTDTAISNLINGAPGTLDTLKEIADWISGDETATAALVGRVGALETATSTTLPGAIATAKSEAIAAAGLDATSKADTAEQNAKRYADGLADNYDASGAAAAVEDKLVDYVKTEDLPDMVPLCEEEIDGTYILKATVLDGEVTYAWVLES